MGTVDRFMQEAIKEARLGAQEGGLPIGSVLVRRNEIIGRGHNRSIQENNPIAHAEIECLRNAGRMPSYKHAVIYSTQMPCPMCAGAIVQFGIEKVIAGESETFPGNREFMEANGVEVIDLSLDECRNLLQDFIAKNPAVWADENPTLADEDVSD